MQRTKVLVLNSRAYDYASLLKSQAPWIEPVPVEEHATVPSSKLLQCKIWFGEPNIAAVLLQKGFKPEWLQLTWAGINRLMPSDLPKDYLLTRAVGVYGQVMAEYVLSYLLANEQQLQYRRDEQSRFHWSPSKPGTLRGKNVLIVGAGSIGTEIARFIQPFGGRLVGVANHQRPIPPFEHVYTLSELPQAVASADYIINVLPDTPCTRDVYSAALFENVKRGAFFINIGRGTSVVDHDLIVAVESGQLSGAVLDVFRKEPLPQTHQFWNTKNIEVTPHVAGPEIPELMVQMFLDNLSRFQSGEKLDGLVDFNAGY
ncbi:D-2-hydroxyacid dehydrogenase [Metapseudomonas lalkuanensis]|uniref:D-2-hydroxyacid dehydrogenase n=1 Tax=Metapseudomonas lalkuanensis TaxID=2604832 RepID=A0A5J6QP85_9GAMM|nr:D-2-hydroxyacid dehydrogenase [Pseudomonas lalkuanensis]QEY64273.1 D-2-hydroxyacid dehydrogenase [Pseudomonas lalkuanensis]